MLRTVVNNISLYIMNVILYFCLIIHHAKRMHRVILSSVVRLAVSYFHITSQTARLSGEKNLNIKFLVFIFCTFLV